MGLVDLFKPKWKHSNPEVRATAVRNLGSNDTATLVQIARNDSDDSVRRIAIRRLSDAEVLTELAQKHLDGALREYASERASQLWLNLALDSDLEQAETGLENVEDDAVLAEIVKRSTIPEIRAKALEKISDDKALSDVARQSKEDDLRLAAVQAVQGVTSLRTIALNGDYRDAALAALARIDDPDSLRVVAKQAKIKALRSKAEKKIRQLKQPKKKGPHEGPTKDERRRHRQAQLIMICSEIEGLSPSIDDPNIEKEFETLCSRWKELAEQDTEFASDLEERLQKAIEAFEEERTVFLQHLETRANQRQAIEKDEELRSSLCRKLMELDETEPLEAAAAIHQEWIDGGPPVEGSTVDWQAKFKAALEDHEKKHTRWHKRQEARTDFTELLAKAEEAVKLDSLGKSRKELGGIRRQWQKLAQKYGVDEDLREKFASVLEIFDERDSKSKEAKKKKQEENKNRLEALIQTLENLKEDGDLREMEKALRNASTALRKPGPLPSKQIFLELKERFKKSERAVQDRLTALREADEWSRLFNVPKQEELCQKAEALIEMEDLSEVAKELRAIQAEWRKVGKSTRGRGNELWSRFKTACDAAYAKCESYFDELKKERADNLKRKEEICLEAESIVDSMEWKATAERLKQLQKEWKAIGSVERKDSDVIWKRFRAACDTFFNRRKEHHKALDAERAENLKIKEGLCERAEILAESSDWHDTTERLKDLQAEWKGIGPVPRKHSDPVWKRFRAACDRFFDRREAHRDGGRRANLERKKEICADIERLLASEASETPPSKEILEYWTEWSTVGPIPFDEVDRVEQEFRDVLGRAIAAYSESFINTDLDPVALKARKRKLIGQLEQLAPKKKADKKSASDENDMSIAEKLQEAMARNTFSQESKSSEKQRAEETATRLLQRWREMPPLPASSEKALETEFTSAYQLVTGHPIPPREESRSKGSSRPRRSGARREKKKQGTPKAERSRREATPPSADVTQAEASNNDSAVSESPAETSVSKASVKDSEKAPARSPSAQAAERPSSLPDTGWSEDSSNGLSFSIPEVDSIVPDAAASDDTPSGETPSDEPSTDTSN